MRKFIFFDFDRNSTPDHRIPTDEQVDKFLKELKDVKWESQEEDTTTP